MLELAAALSEPAVDVTFAFYAGEEVAREHNGLLAIAAVSPDLLHGDARRSRRADLRSYRGRMPRGPEAGRRGRGFAGAHRPPMDGYQRHPPAWHQSWRPWTRIRLASR